MNAEDIRFYQAIARGIAYGLAGAYLVSLGVSACAKRTYLASPDDRAILNQQRACEAIHVRATALLDAGAIVSLAESCYCNGQGALRRAGQPYDDGGIACPR